MVPPWGLLAFVLVAAMVLTARVSAAPGAHAGATPFPQEEYGYVPISAEFDSAMFYALRAPANQTARHRAPLVMWLQGGPGATSLFGDYLESGPQTLYATATGDGYALRENPYTWAKHATVLYVDNPVGTGFSYTRKPGGFSTTDEEITENLLAFLKGFLQVHPEFASGTPFWVLSESYGGKMTAYFGAALAAAVRSGELALNFRGVGLGDGWVDPIACMKSYAPYLQAASLVNAEQAANVTRYAEFAQNELGTGNGTGATYWWGVQQDFVSDFTGGVNWYNIRYFYDYTADDQLNTFLATNFTRARGALIPSGVQYGAQAGAVFAHMGGSFMRNGIDKVDAILRAGFEVHVLSGQLDLIVDTLCTVRWMEKLPWPQLREFQRAARTPRASPGVRNVQLFHQHFAELHMWEVVGAGHMIPLDQPQAAELMFVSIIGGDTAAVAHTPAAHQERDAAAAAAAALKRGGSALGPRRRRYRPH